MSIFDFKKKKDSGKKVEKKSTVVKAGKEDVGNKAVKDLYAGEGSKTNKETTGDYKNSYRILIKPLITEKASILGSQNKYFFEVDKNSNKVEVAKAIKSVYGVMPEKVNIVSVGGKKVRTGRVAGKKKDWKKAIVTLPEGKSIKIYEGV